MIPALGYVSILPYAGHLQYNDYYGILGSVVDGDHLTHDPVRWLTVKSNEHTVALSVAIYVANLLLTGGDNLGLSAFSLGIANKFLEPYAGAVLAKILVLVFIILFIQKRPRGLFALKGRAVEA